jgi:hypothetical protein
MSKEQTAIDWLINAIEANMDDIPFEVKQQAKSIEKEQMKKMLVWLDDTYRTPNEIEEVFEQYYKETYRGDTIQNK